MVRDSGGYMRRYLPLLLALSAGLTACAHQSAEPDLETVRQQVFQAESAFAQAMADRNLEEFSRYVSEEAVFFSGPEPLRGKAAVTAWWAQFFATPAAPFSWEPDEVEPLASGTLAHSSGPVRDPSGQVTARFNSIWRQEAPGVWRVVFDKGSPLPPQQSQ
jgi:ketosteroid isomerase-like protein